MSKIIALVGATASGKSELAMKLAIQTGAHIMSCDSLLVYKNLEIGTAKPSHQELKQIPHYGIDLVEPESGFTAADFTRYARPILEDLIARNIPTLIVGGTGFYLKALLHGIWDAPPTNLEFRNALLLPFKDLDDQQISQSLHKTLALKDPEYSLKVNQNDLYRVIRGLEIIHESGKTVSEILNKKKNLNPFPFEIPIFGIERDKASLEKRIIERTNKMFEQGLVNEVKRLVEKYHNDFPKPLHSVGYQECIDFLNGRYKNIHECKERVIISTRQLAKKQRTFFNGMGLPIKWFHLPKEEEILSNEALKILNNT